MWVAGLVSVLPLLRLETVWLWRAFVAESRVNVDQELGSESEGEAFVTYDTRSFWLDGEAKSTAVGDTGLLESS
jgi:hypothetical protein